MEGFSWSMQGTCCWRETVTLLFTWGKIEVLSVFSLFFDRSGSVCWCKCVYTHTQAHTAREVLESEPMGRDETLPSRSEGSRWTKSRHIWTRMCTYNVHTCIYTTVLGGGMRSCTNYFFCSIYFSFHRKAIVVNVTPRTRIHMDSSYINSQSRAPN